MGKYIFLNNFITYNQDQIRPKSVPILGSKNQHDLRSNINVKIKALLLYKESQHMVFYLVGFLWLTLAKYLSN